MCFSQRFPTFVIKMILGTRQTTYHLHHLHPLPSPQYLLYAIRRIQASLPNTPPGSRNGLAITLAVVRTIFCLHVISGIWWLIRWLRDDYDYPQANNHPLEMSNATTTTTPAYYPSGSTRSRGRDASRFRSIPSEVANARRSRPSTVIPSKLKNPLTTIPEALRETSIVRHASRSPVQDRRREYIPSPSPHIMS